MGEMKLRGMQKREREREMEKIEKSRLEKRSGKRGKLKTEGEVEEETNTVELRIESRQEKITEEFLLGRERDKRSLGQKRDREKLCVDFL